MNKEFGHGKNCYQKNQVHIYISFELVVGEFTVDEKAVAHNLK
jgi:hypothetical protein